MITLDYTQVPKTFSLCIRNECPLAGQCLRGIAWDILPSSEECVRIVNPKSFESGTECRDYRSAVPAIYARGFRVMQAKMLPSQYARFSEKLMGHFSRTAYYEHRRGTMLCTPNDIVYIRGVLNELELPHLEFDVYEEHYNWID